jgi:hypothetical protein
MASGGDTLAEKWKLEAEARAYVEEKQLQPLVADLMASLVLEKPSNPVDHLIRVLKSKLPENQPQSAAE